VHKKTSSFDHLVGAAKQWQRHRETIPRHVNARPISVRNFEHDLAFGITFLDILVRWADLVEAKHFADFGLDLAGID